MSDYISLEELRAMSGEELKRRWQGAEFPFDLATCEQCVTQHKFLRFCSHRDFGEQAGRLKIAFQPRAQELRDNLPEIYALRMYFRDAYPSTPEPPVTAEPACQTAGREPRVLAAK